MTRLVYVSIVLAALSLPNGASAQDKYDQFVGHWVAAAQIASACSDLTVLNQQSAADIARSQEGLRRQKVLRLVLYGKTAQLEQQGTSTLAARNLDPSNKQALCQFGRSVAGKNDTIGRFLKTN